MNKTVPSKPRSSDWLDDRPMLPAIVTHDDPVEESGLVDKDGNKLVRRRDPVGFVRFRS